MSNSPTHTLPRAPNLVLQPAGWPQPKGYANGIKARGDLLFIGGMIGWDEHERFPADFVGQTRQLLANILAVLAEGGASARHIVRMTWYVRDMDEYLKARPALGELWRVLKAGGLLFVRLGSRIGMDFEHLHGNIFRIGDGSEWFLVDQKMLLDLTREMNAALIDPLKTTVVQDHRCMTTWIVRKR